MILNKEEENLQEFVNGFIKCMYWTDELNENLDMPKETLFKIFIECQRFIKVCGTFQNNPIPEDKYEQTGHDFWLTRNGHGSGFWDKEELYGEKNAEILTEISKKFGEVWTYISDDNHLEIM